MIDDNVQLIDMVKEYFSSSNDVSIELEAHDGLEGMKMIEEKISFAIAKQKNV